MSVIKLQATADADGRLRLDLPARPGWTYDLQVFVTVAPPIPPEATAEERGWPPGYEEMIWNGFGDTDDEDDSHWDQYLHRDQDRPDAAGGR